MGSLRLTTTLQARGPAAFRFTPTTLQHASPDAKLERGEITSSPQGLAVQLWLS